MTIIRDPVDRDRRRLVATTEIRRNKLKEDALEHKKGESYSFSTTLMPYPLLCFTRLVAVLGIHFKAFEDDITSVDDLLNRPNLEDVDYIPIKWKDDMLDSLILPMSWPVFIRIFRRCLLVDGCPFSPRLYAMRVSVGADLDGCLTSAMRNFIMSHSTHVYENNYMSKHVRVDLAKLRFGEFAGSNDDLFQILRDLCLRNDPNAPIDPTPEHLASIEKRNDVTGPRNAFELAAKGFDPKLAEEGINVKLAQENSYLQLTPEEISQKEVRKHKTKLDKRRRRLEEMHVLDSREKYSSQAASLRLRGLSTVHIRRPGPSGRRSHAGLRMEEVVGEWTEDVTQDTIVEDRSTKTMAWLMNYMAGAWKILEAPHLTGKGDEASQPEEMARCFLCCAKPMKPTSITRHYKSKHVHTGIFDLPLSRPECLALGLEPAIVNGASEFRSHVEAAHGKIHAPCLVTLPAGRRVGPACFVCKIGLPQNAAKHFSQRHTGTISSDQLFRCPGTEAGKQEHTGEALLLHLAEDHAYPSIRRCPFCGLLTTERGLTTHMRRHFGDDADPVPCPWCLKDDDEMRDAPVLFSDYATWAAHVATMPSQGAPATASGRSRSKPKRKMEPDATYRAMCPPSPPFDTNEELGGGVGHAAEPEPAAAEHGSAQAIFSMPSPPLSTEENDGREPAGDEPEAQVSAKRTRLDVTDEMEGLGIDSGMPIDPLLMDDGTSSCSWLSAGGSADTPEYDFVFVDDKDREDVGVGDFQLEEEDFCAMDDDYFDLDSDTEWQNGYVHDFAFELCI